MASEDPASACPVDHNAREAWMKAAAGQRQPPAGDSARPLAPHPLPPQYATATPDESAAACPVDPKAREAWLKAATGGGDGSTASQAATQLPARPKFASSRPLSTHREISTIPRGGLAAPTSTISSSATPSAEPTTTTTKTKTPLAPPQTSPLAHGVPPSAASPNSQTHDPHTSATGHWIYPSEQMFFSAMRRKAYDPRAEDMASIIPIHNAVNERTWANILAWERRADASTWQRCGGPKLVSFAGDSGRLTPRARWRVLLGYQAPFDRHDWVVERCGQQRVEYVIDFYQGKAGPNSNNSSNGKNGGGAAAPSFYLDARPKLNSIEGVRMRIARFWGFG